MATIKMKDPSFSAIKRDLRGPAVLTAARRYKWCQIKTVGFIFKKTPPSSRSSLPYLPRLSSLTLVGDGGFLSAVAAAFSRIQILSLSLNPGPAFIFEWMENQRMNEWMNDYQLPAFLFTRLHSGRPRRGPVLKNSHSLFIGEMIPRCETFRPRS